MNLLLEFWFSMISFRFLAMLANLGPERTRRLPRILCIFTNLRRERNVVIARFLSIFTNFTQESREPLARFFFFSWIWEQKGVRLFFDFSLVCPIADYKGINSLLDFFFFFFTDLRLERSKLNVWFLAILTKLALQRVHKLLCFSLLSRTWGQRGVILFLDF